jgi:transposase, IS5 family
MSHKEVGQLSLADGLIGRGRKKSALDRLDGVMEWRAFERLLSGVYSARRGRPSYPPLVLMKCLLLQQWYGLSDPGLEEALFDRLSFRRFAGLSLDEAVPDHSTVSRFRKQLTAQGLSERLLEEVNRQLDAHGLMLRQGTLIDASIIAADAAPRHQDRGPGVGGPGAKTLGTFSKADRDAAWTVKHKRAYFGYKAHIAVDRGSGLIRKAILTPANVHDSTPADALIMGDEAAVYADKAYAQRERRSRLAAAGIEDAIMHRHTRHRRMSAADQRRNAEIAPVRAAVERTFGLMKRWYGYSRVRYRSLQRNALQLQLLAMAINLKRAVKLGAA